MAISEEESMRQLREAVAEQNAKIESLKQHLASTQDPQEEPLEAKAPNDAPNKEEVAVEKTIEDDEKDDPKKKRERMDKMYPMRHTIIPLGCGKEAYLNGFTSFFGFAFLWGLAIWCMIDPDGSFEKLKEWQAAVTLKFTWFYIVANPAFTFFVFFLAYRYGDIRLGKPDEKPEFDDMSYFMMLFSAGVGVGLFFYGVSEPLWHQNSHWFAEAGYRSQDEIDQWALMITMFHWGFAGWSPYLVVAIAAGIAAYRFDMPMTVRSALYEIFGAYTWGWIGDVIDGFSMVMTVAGVCTSLGLGAAQLSTGAQRLGWMEDDLTEDELTSRNVIIIWIITLIATASVVSGIGVGIKLLSQIGFCIGIAILFLCLVMEKTNYLFNVQVQTIGYYFQWCIFQVPFWTDAFGQLLPGEGRSVDGNSSATWWMNAWTVFYMAWWTAWGAFVGLFLARISRGRTIRSVVLFSFLAPLFFSFLWFCTFGGIGLRQSRQALELQDLGSTFYNDTAYFQTEDSQYCYNVPQNDVTVNGTVVFHNTLPGITPVCELDSTDATQSWFNVMYSFSYPEGGFSGFGDFMAGFSMIGLAIYFVTSSDSGSLVVDHLASNGQEDHHWLQRVFWAFTEGAVATGLIVAGKSKALQALQAASIVFGLPFNLFLFAMMFSTVKMLNIAESQDKDKSRTATSARHLPEPDDTSFAMPVYGGIFNVFEFVVSIGCVHEDRVRRGMDLPRTSQVVEFFIGLVFPFVSLWRILTSLGRSTGTKVSIVLCYTVMFLGWIGLFVCGALINFGFLAFAFLMFFMNGCILTAVRMDVRDKFELDGNFFGDFLWSSFLYFQTLCQMIYQFQVADLPGAETGHQHAEGDWQDNVSA